MFDQHTTHIYLTVRCWTSLQVSSGLASRQRATMPAARGAEAEVPVCDEVHRWCRSVVTTFDELGNTQMTSA